MRHSRTLYLLLCLLVLVAIMVFGLVRHTATPTPSPPMSKYPSVLERVELPPEYQIEVIYPAPLACPDGIAITPSGNLLIGEGGAGDVKEVTVDYSENFNVGPSFSSLFEIAADGDVKILVKFADQVPSFLVDIAISPSGDVFLLAHPLDGFEIRKVSPEGEVSIFASHLPIDPFSIIFNAEGNLFFSCSTGIYRVFRNIG